MRFASLGSGSKGNATLVSAGGSLLLVDCGFSVREAERRLAPLGVSATDIDAILVTHEHSDHCAGVARLSRRHQIPVYLTHGTLGSGRIDACHSVHPIHSEEPFRIGAIDVQPVAVPHDAREPCQYRFSCAGRTLGVLTDLGSITPHVVRHYRGCDGLVLEFNHDLTMLQGGSYPPSLKRRVAGDWGHLNNHQAAALLQEIGIADLHYLVVAHISENNNCRERAEEALVSVYGALDERVVWADQQGGFGWLELPQSDGA
ncbi:MBL fold metallo-hydrolase [Parahaliea maris]|uniref:MBL fold metallo-hydrolase n=1 Tax=Parahaliea maris TaxID=2716870 RepID=A0A5C8ZUD0_9GAMM|nr:MBL fold metallo-hydrolase [Parahaliea maris]TXS92113.1 MBL fold metallo-hydrolase [Parahaliea maris]